MTDIAIPGPKWIPAFLEKLAETRCVAEAVAVSGITRNGVLRQRRANRQFAESWDIALAEGVVRLEDTPEPIVTNGKWQKQFLDLLAETSNIRFSAQQANVPLSTVYRRRASDSGFAAKWETALYEGYTNLEMEVLGYLRDPDPGYKMDVANALRLLAAHKESAAREKARRSRRDRGEVLARLNAKIDKMRERKAAAEKLLAEEGVQMPVAHARA
ncbi:hypothetical protein [Aurantiacibacter poecillastricola]|uniref:hypothetical protein n=1 Tax=Aurantiacibacter poecillastricola TaxID=3064385 RepID=UPI00273E5A22|nr:hypothetical protein [Aurantiacibacter sp. 219JJ12-13]MDP5260302.1 hypothetical protein [Aurantiacibacter sp. 219JJ12-13]